MNDLKIEYVDIKGIKPYKNNAKKHPDSQVDNVAESIKTLGWRQPIVLDKDGVIIIGHGRYLAAKKLGLETVPCHYATDLTAEQVKKLRILDNKLNESEWDLDLLKLDAKGLDFKEYDLEWGGIFEDDTPDVVVEDEIPEVDEIGETQTELGDIWQLGDHRLICGDSTDALNINILMQGKKADLVFTDPPYGMKKESEGVLNDNLNFDDLLKFNKEWIPHTFDALKETGSWYCWGIDEPLMDIYHEILKPMIKANKITFRNLITWDKGSGQGQMSSEFRMYPIADEKCLFVMCGVQGFNTNKDNYFEGWESVRSYLAKEAKKAGIGAKEVKEICGCGMYAHWFTKSQWVFLTEEHYLRLQAYCKANGIEAFKREYEEVKREYYATRAYFDNTHDNQNNVWHFNKLTGNSEERELTGGHATPKPIALCSRAIKSSSREGEIVLDVFGGSGSTLIACEQLNRKCYMMELDPKYCDVIIKRWETLTGKKAVKL